MSISPSKVRSQRQLIVVLKEGAGQIKHDPATAAEPAITSTLGATLAKYGAAITPVLMADTKSGRMAVPGAAPNASAVHLTRYHHVTKLADDHLEMARDELKSNPQVETAYIKPAGEPPALRAARLPLASVAATPNFGEGQNYLAAAPAGVDARFAWNKRGGRGAGVRIVDCEWAWNFQHEDLQDHCDGAAVGSPTATDDDHGTAVIGTIIGNDNGFGITGIAPDAELSTACFGEDSNSPATSAVIIQAADLLSPGDILLLEIHRPGPRATGAGQEGYIPIEWWPDDFHAISYAASKGIIVVEAGGNGGENLDDPIYNSPNPDFPQGWKNPFAPVASGGRDSGAIVVGAGNPPSGTHGRTTDTLGFNENYLDRARCTFSNYGTRIDCQGWGWEVTTLGYGDLWPGNGAGGQSSRNELYTNMFAGTSSASPIVVGALACAQGALKGAAKPVMTPDGARQLLRTTGSPQQSAAGRPSTQQIGSRPDLRALLTQLIQPVPNIALGPGGSRGVESVAARPSAPWSWIAALAATATVLVTLGMGWAGVEAGSLTASPLLAWFLDIVLIVLFLAALGGQSQNSAAGLAIDWRNRLSLSRLQILLWTTLFVATLLVVFVWNIAHAHPLDVQIPAATWLIMGISGATAIGGPLILSGKPASAPMGSPLPPTGFTAQGTVVFRPTGARRSLADLVLGDELGDAATPDIGKIQQLLFTLVAIVTYAAAIGVLLYGTRDTAPISSLPEMSAGFLSLLAASSATYLGYKAVPKS